MDDGGKGAGGYGCASKGPLDGVQGGFPGSTAVWEQNMGVNGCNDDGPGRFHHRISRRIAGMTARRGYGREWEWASLEAALEATWIWLMRGYIRRRKATIAEYVIGRPIYKICTGAEKMEVLSRFIRLWDQ